MERYVMTAVGKDSSRWIDDHEVIDGRRARVTRKQAVRHVCPDGDVAVPLAIGCPWLDVKVSVNGGGARPDIHPLVGDILLPDRRSLAAVIDIGVGGATGRVGVLEAVALGGLGDVVASEDVALRILSSISIDFNTVSVATVDLVGLNEVVVALDQ